MSGAIEKTNSFNTSNSNSNSNACVVCYKNAKYYSIGMCEHPVCFECSTRMRVLCQQNECPICRQDLPKVVFTKEIKPFRFLRKGTLVDTRYNIYFESPEIEKDFTQLLSHECNVCEDQQVFSSFNSLQDHMRRKHDLHYCDLCVENVKIFSYERRCYTKSDLSRHRRKGDVDDKSHRGHPICEFCDTRYMDNDELYRHLRRDHLFCHFCDAEGLHHCYSSYEYLKAHFRQEHFLCEEGECADEQFTSVFRSDIDLKAHKASVHGKQLGKAAAKQARTLELEFALTPRADFRNRRGNREDAGSSHPRNSTDEARPNYPRNPHIYQRPESPPPVPEPTFVQQPLCDVQSTQEFPTLGNTPAKPIATASMGPSRSRGNSSLTIRGVLKNNYKENFPALGPDSPTHGAAAPTSTASSKLTKSFNVSVSSSKSSSSATGGKAKQTPNLSIHVNHRPNGTVMTRLSGQGNLRINSIPSTSRDMDFPALGRMVAEAAAAPVSTANPASWTKVTCVKPEAMPKKKQVTPPPMPPPIRSGEDFPSLAKPSKLVNKAPAPSKPPAPAGPSWMQLTDSGNSSSATMDATKGKAKKKKLKQQNEKTSNGNGNNTSSNDSSFSGKVNKVTVDNVNKNSAKNKEVQEPSKKGKSKTKQNSDQDNFKGNSQESSSNKTNAAASAATAAPVSAQRKRSELKIENLNSANNNKNIEVKTAKKVETKVEDFPALGRTPSRPPGLPSPPPGFAAPVTLKPPPGFLNQVNGFTFTNSSGESYTIVPDKVEQHQPVYSYLAPPNFQRRNQNLIAEFNNCFGSEESEELKAFRYISGLFRTGACDADKYYKQCRTVMGAKAFNRVFPELLALLPDIKKQRELFEVHKREMSSGKISGLVSCANCGQILRSSDLQDHASSHTLENHFPVLGKTGVSSGPWHKK